MTGASQTGPGSQAQNAPSALLGTAGASVVIDTSVWASRLLPHDSNHQAARTWIDNYILNGGSFVAPMIFVIEIASVIARETLPPNNPQDDAHKAVSQLYALPI